MKILDIDIGNTRLKWRVVSEDKRSLAMAENAFISRQSQETNFFIEELKKQISDFEHDIERVRIASVRSSGFEDQFKQTINQWLNLEAEFARTSSDVRVEGITITNSYSRPSDMGVDRWCAIVAGAMRYKGQACCVIDAGSAMTIDCLSADAQHLGGYILPGFEMQVRALLANTDRINAEDVLDMSRHKHDVLAPAADTVSAVRSGVLINLTGALGEMLRNNPWQIDQYQVPVLISGGDGKMLCDLLKGGEMKNVAYNSSLVFDGLGYLLP